MSESAIQRADWSFRSLKASPSIKISFVTASSVTSVLPIDVPINQSHPLLRMKVGLRVL